MKCQRRQQKYGTNKAMKENHVAPKTFCITQVSFMKQYDGNLQALDDTISTQERIHHCITRHFNS